MESSVPKQVPGAVLQIDVNSDAGSVAIYPESSGHSSPGNESSGGSFTHLQDLISNHELNGSEGHEEILSELGELNQQYQCMKRVSEELQIENTILTSTNDQLKSELEQLRHTSLVRAAARIASSPQSTLSPQMDQSHPEGSLTPKSSLGRPLSCGPVAFAASPASDVSAVATGTPSLFSTSTSAGVPGFSSPADEEFYPFLDQIGTLQSDLNRLQSMYSSAESSRQFLLEENKRLSESLKRRESEVTQLQHVEKDLRSKLHKINDRSREVLHRSALSSSSGGGASGGANTGSLNSSGGGGGGGGGGGAPGSNGGSAISSPRPKWATKELDQARMDLLEDDNASLSSQVERLISEIESLTNQLESQKSRNELLQSTVSDLQSDLERAMSRPCAIASAPALSSLESTPLDAAASSVSEQSEHGSLVYPVTREEYQELRRELEEKEVKYQELEQKYQFQDRNLRELERACSDSHSSSVVGSVGNDVHLESLLLLMYGARMSSLDSVCSGDALDSYSQSALAMHHLTKLNQYKSVIDEMRQQLQQYAEDESLKQESIECVELSSGHCHEITSAVDAVYDKVSRRESPFDSEACDYESQESSPPRALERHLKQQNESLRQLLFSIHPKLHKLTDDLNSVQTLLGADDCSNVFVPTQPLPSPRCLTAVVALEHSLFPSSPPASVPAAPAVSRLSVCEVMEHSLRPLSLLDRFADLSSEWVRIDESLSLFENASPSASASLRDVHRKLGCFLQCSLEGLRSGVESEGDFTPGFLSEQRRVLGGGAEKNLHPMHEECAKNFEDREVEVEGMMQELQLYQVDNDCLLEKLQKVSEALDRAILLNQAQVARCNTDMQAAKKSHEGEMQKLTKSHKSSMMKLTAEMTGLNSEIQSLKSSIRTLEESNSSLATDLESARLSNVDLSGRLQEKVSELSGKEGLLQTKRATVAEMELMIFDNSSTIASLQSTLQEKEVIIQEKEVILQEKEVILQEKEAALQEKDAIIFEKENTIQIQESAIQHRDEIILTHTMNLSAESSRMQSLESEVQSKAEDLHHQEFVLQEKEGHIMDLESALHRKDAELNEKEVELQRLVGVLDISSATQENLSSSLRARDAELEEKEQIIGDKELLLKNLQRLLEAKDLDCVHVEASAVEARSEVSRLSSSLSACERSRSDLESTVKRLESSIHPELKGEPSLEECVLLLLTVHAIDREEISELKQSNDSLSVHLQAMLDQLVDRQEAESLHPAALQSDAPLPPPEAESAVPPQSILDRMQELESQNATLIDQLQELSEKKAILSDCESAMPELLQAVERNESLQAENSQLYDRLRALESLHAPSTGSSILNQSSSPSSPTALLLFQQQQSFSQLDQKQSVRDAWSDERENRLRVLANHIIHNHREQYRRLMSDYSQLQEENRLLVASCRESYSASQ